MTSEQQNSSNGNVPDLNYVIRRSGQTNTYIAPRAAFRFPESTFPDYDAFDSLTGESMKQEIRTTIQRVALPGVSDDEPEMDGVLKIYRYPGLTGLRTWGQPSKATRELFGLALCQACSFPSVEGMASGARRSPWGFVAECFILTRLEPDLTALRDWLESMQGKPDATSIIEGALQELGQYMKACHAERLFILSPNAKNVHVRLASGRYAGLVLLDVPYARHIHADAGARWAQGRDLGALYGSIVKRTDPNHFEAFYAGYGDDPMGDSPEQLRKRTQRGAETFLHQTPLSRALSGIRRGFLGNKR